MNEKLFSEFPPVSKEEWQSAIEKELKGKPFDSLIWHTEEGFDVLPFYTQDNIQKLSTYNQQLTTNSNWEIRENIVVSNVQSANKKALEVLNSGANSLNFIFNKIKSQNEFNLLLKDILPEYISLHFTCKRNPIQILKWFKKHVGKKKRNILGSVIFEPIENKVLRKDVFDICTELSGFSPFFRGITISVSDEKLITAQISSAISESNFILKKLIKKGFPIDEIAARIQFSFPVGNNYFFEIAKIRAMRILWAKVIEQYKPKHECSLITFIHSEISPTPTLPNGEGESIAQISKIKVLPFGKDLGWAISNTSRLMSASIGGSNSISINSEDKFSERINRSIRLIAKEEAYLNLINDAAGGSYYIENLTKKIAEESWKIFSNEK